MKNKDVMRILSEDKAWIRSLERFKSENYMSPFSEWKDGTEEIYEAMKLDYQAWLDSDVMKL